MFEFDIFLIFTCYPWTSEIDGKQESFKMQSWAIMVIVNIRFFLNKLYYDKKKQFKSMKFYTQKQQS